MELQVVLKDFVVIVVGGAYKSVHELAFLL